MTSPYITQTEFTTTIANKIKDLLDNVYDKHSKQDAKFKETIGETIPYQGAKLGQCESDQISSMWMLLWMVTFYAADDWSLVVLEN